MRESDDEKTWTPMIPVPDEAIPAVAPDDELEDTIRRIHESNEFLPPFPGYGSRSEVRIEPEDPYADGFSLAAHAFVAMVAFGLGGIAGCLLMLV